MQVSLSDRMEGQDSQQNQDQLIRRNDAGNDGCAIRSHQNQPVATSSGTKQEQPESDVLLSRWLHPSMMPRSYLELLNQNSPYVEGDPILNAMQPKAMENVSGNEKKGTTCNTLAPRITDHKSPVLSSSFQNEAWKAESSLRTQNLHDREASASIVQTQALRGASKKPALTNSQNRLQDNLVIEKRPMEENCNSRHRVAQPGSVSRRRTAARQRAAITDRERRLRIAEKIKALQELLPNPTEGNQESTLNDIIAHVKFLQLQLKELSRSRLGGELTPHPFISIEGYGHYIHHDQMMNEPLEEMLAKLLEGDPSAASRLFEGKGLCLLPMDLVKTFTKI